MIGQSPAGCSIPLRSGSVVRVGILLLFLFLSPAHAPANDSLDPAHPGDPLPGRDFAGLCASCHGTQGRSTNPMVPSLAGQDGAYLNSQLRNFQAQNRRHAAMQGILARLTAKDMAEMALYYEKQPPMKGKGVSRKTKIGAPVYEGCKGCHGNSAKGGRGVPRLAGQQAVYLERKLLEYQAGTRSTPGMNEAVARLTPEQIKALSLYLSSMK
jgi:cytochrome c553